MAYKVTAASDIKVPEHSASILFHIRLNIDKPVTLPLVVYNDMIDFE